MLNLNIKKRKNKMETYEITLNENTKIGKEIFMFLQQHNVPIKLKEKTKMSKEEFDAMIEESRAQYARGEYHTMLPSESLDDFLDRIG